MCGIAGFVARTPNLEGRYAPIVAALLGASEVRGRHATGVATNPLGDWTVTKAPGPATQLVRTPEFQTALMTPWTVALGHTRAATHGRPEDNRNNHPFLVQHIIGVHNGVLRNHEAIQRQYHLTVQGEADSEVLYARLAQLAEGHSVGPRDVEQIFEDFAGSYALAWIDRRVNDTVYLTVGPLRPLAWAEIPEGFAFASTEEILDAALTPLQIPFLQRGTVPRGMLLRVHRTGAGEFELVWDRVEPLWKTERAESYNARKAAERKGGLADKRPPAPATPEFVEDAYVPLRYRQGDLYADVMREMDLAGDTDAPSDWTGALGMRIPIGMNDTPPTGRAARPQKRRVRRAQPNRVQTAQHWDWDF